MIATQGAILTYIDVYKRGRLANAWQRHGSPASSEERKRALSVFVKPFGAVIISFVLGLIGVIPRTVEGR